MGRLLFRKKNEIKINGLYARSSVLWQMHLVKITSLVLWTKCSDSHVSTPFQRNEIISHWGICWSVLLGAYKRKGLAMSEKEKAVYELLIGTLSVYARAVAIVKDSRKAAFLSDRIDGILSTMRVLGYIEPMEQMGVKNAMYEFSRHILNN